MSDTNDTIKIVDDESLSTIFTIMKSNFIGKSSELKAHYDAAYNHSQAAHAPSNAQANVLESISVNGTQQNITDKNVDISVPTVPAMATNIATEPTNTTKTVSPKAVADYVNSSITTAIGNIQKITKKILQNTGDPDDEDYVEEYDPESRIPTIENPEDNVIYLVPLDDVDTNNAYNEFMYINDQFELIGNTQVDLSGYIHVSNITTYSDDEIEEIWEEADEALGSD